MCADNQSQSLLATPLRRATSDCCRWLVTTDRHFKINIVIRLPFFLATFAIGCNSYLFQFLLLVIPSGKINIDPENKTFLVEC